MAQFTHFTNLNPEDEYPLDEFLNNADFDQDDWDLDGSEGLNLDQDDDTWGQVGMDDLDFDDLDDFDEDTDDFHGAF